MRYYKSKGGYFYKEYKSGKKIRISNKDYHKQSKNQKQKGGSNRPIIKVENLRIAYSHENLKKLFNTKPLINHGRPLVTAYIETKLPDRISSILTTSFFYNQCMKPLLNLKNVKVKRANVNNNFEDNAMSYDVFSTIAEPFFPNIKYPNFQDRLFEWWVDISANFKNGTEDYCFTKQEIDLKLINQGPNKNTDYFYLQLPVVFINRILQMLQFYIRILAEKNINNLIKTKNNIKNQSMINFYKTTNTSSEPIEPNLLKLYNKALKSFNDFIKSLDSFYETNFQYNGLYEVEASVLKWYQENVHISIDTYARKVHLQNNHTNRCNKAINNLQSYFDNSYELSYCYLPTSMDPKEEKYLSIYCIPVVLYLGKCIVVHEGKIQLAHPVLQLTHDIMIHNGILIYNYSLISNGDMFPTTMLFRKEFIKEIVNYQLANFQKKNLYKFLFEIIHELGNIGILLQKSRMSGIISGDSMFKHLFFNKNEFNKTVKHYNIFDDYFFNPILLYAISKLIPKINKYKYVKIVYFNNKNEFDYNNFIYISKSLKLAFERVYQKEIPLLKFYYKNKKLNLKKLHEHNDLNNNKLTNITSNELKTIEKVYLTKKDLESYEFNFSHIDRNNGLDFISYESLFPIDNQ